MKKDQTVKWEDNFGRFSIIKILKKRSSKKKVWLAERVSKIINEKSAFGF